MLNDNEWKLTILSLCMFVAGVMGGCGFLFTGSLWRLALFVVAGVVYVAAVAWHLEAGRDP